MLITAVTALYVRYTYVYTFMIFNDTTEIHFKAAPVETN